MIEKLLQFLVAKIDAQLFEAIEVKDFEACNVQHSNEANPKIKSVNHFWSTVMYVGDMELDLMEEENSRR